MLLAKLRADQLVARKAKDDVRSALLTALVSEAAMVGKNAGNRESTDDEVIAVVKKFLKNAEETRGHAQKRAQTDSSVNLADIDREIAILGDYLPQQMSADEIREVIVTFKGSNPSANMGLVMKHLKDNFGGKYDGKLASEIAKTA